MSAGFPSGEIRDSSGGAPASQREGDTLTDSPPRGSTVSRVATRREYEVPDLSRQPSAAAMTSRHELENGGKTYAQRIGATPAAGQAERARTKSAHAIECARVFTGSRCPAQSDRLRIGGADRHCFREARCGWNDTRDAILGRLRAATSVNPGEAKPNAPVISVGRSALEKLEITARYSTRSQSTLLRSRRSSIRLKAVPSMSHRSDLTDPSPKQKLTTPPECALPQRFR